MRAFGAQNARGTTGVAHSLSAPRREEAGEDARRRRAGGRRSRKKPRELLLLFDDPEVGAALAVPVQIVPIVPFARECWRVIAVALDDVADLGEPIREEHFVHRLVAARTSPKSVLD